GKGAAWANGLSLFSFLANARDLNRRDFALQGTSWLAEIRNFRALHPVMFVFACRPLVAREVLSIIIVVPRCARNNADVNNLTHLRRTKQNVCAFGDFETVNVSNGIVWC